MRGCGLILVALLAGCTATQSRHAVASFQAAQDADLPAGRVIADFSSDSDIVNWRKYVVQGSVNDPVAELDHGALRITSDSSAGLFWHKVELDPVREPLLRWRWKVSQAWGTSTPLAPEFDNFPARLLVGFDAGWQGAGPAALEFKRKVEAHTGVTPPAHAICYTFGGKLPATEAVDAAFGEGRIVVINLRPQLDAGQWHWQTRDLRADYRAIWGSEPPPVVAMALGSDSHRVGLRVQAWFDDISAFPASAAAALRAELGQQEPRRRAPPLVWLILGLCAGVASGTAGWWVWRTTRARK